MSAGEEPVRKKRLVLSALLIFLLHLVGLWFLQRSSPEKEQVTKRVQAFPQVWSGLRTPRAEESLATLVDVDPALFAIPSTRGFSGKVWMKGPVSEYPSPEWSEEPKWLQMSPEVFPADLRPLVGERGLEPLPLQRASIPLLETRPVVQPIATNSLVEVRGQLSPRVYQSNTNLQAWENNEPLTNTVVQVGANARGEVIISRLLSRSGFAPADQLALEWARKIPVQPLTGAAAGDLGLVFGEVIFRWHTVPLRSTNAPPGQ